MSYKNKETAWIYFVISIFLFWFKGGIVIIAILWATFFLIDLPRGSKELKKYNQYLNQQSKRKPDSSSSINTIKGRTYTKKEEKIYQRSMEIEKELRASISKMNRRIESK